MSDDLDTPPDVFLRYGPPYTSWDNLTAEQRDAWHDLQRGVSASAALIAHVRHTP